MLKLPTSPTTDTKNIPEAALPFVKMHGLGNDFVMIALADLTDHAPFADAVKAGRNPLPAMAKKFCDRNFGIGADGLIIGFSLGNELSKKSSETAKNNVADADILKVLDANYVNGGACDIGWIYINSDGSSSAMCGNGLRCLALWAVERKLVASSRLLVSTKVGPVEIFVETASGITVDLGQPILQPSLIPLTSDQTENFIAREIKTSSQTFNATCVSMGNPHAVIFDAESAKMSFESMKFDQALIEQSIEIQKNSLFPEGVNVEFARVSAKDQIEVLVYERGCGPTLACASGAAAVLVAGVLEGRTSRKASVILPGGALSIEWSEATNHVLMSGPASVVFEGAIPASTLSQAISMEAFSS